LPTQVPFSQPWQPGQLLSEQQTSAATQIIVPFWSQQFGVAPLQQTGPAGELWQRLPGQFMQIPVDASQY
jgi:hypothetical protein